MCYNTNMKRVMILTIMGMLWAMRDNWLHQCSGVRNDESLPYNMASLPALCPEVWTIGPRYGLFLKADVGHIFKMCVRSVKSFTGGTTRC